MSLNFILVNFTSCTSPKEPESIFLRYEIFGSNPEIYISSPAHDRKTLIAYARNVMLFMDELKTRARRLNGFDISGLRHPFGEGSPIQV